MVDAKTTWRWYFAIAMGRKAGHLALGIGKAAGATLTLIPEEFPKFKTNLQTLADTLAGAIIKRRAEGHHDGVAVLAEGLVESLPEEDLKQFGNIELDDHGHVRFAEIDIGDVHQAGHGQAAQGAGHQDHHRLEEHRLRAALRRPGAVSTWSTPATSATAPPSTCSRGGNAAMVSLQGGNFVPIPFAQMLDPADRAHAGAHGGHPLHPLRHRPPLHDPPAPRRLRGSDDGEKFADVAHLSPDDFRKQFAYLVENEAAPLDLLHRDGSRR